eukprot:TRINITY_DN335_c0_g1_i1.p1 TRINITY_DN335_c0_g1~~TRINITY_DN335_c0_g1_i1.p1  ORF type:complete len:175 (-),score=54.30 TRINITY_DN335_c0_g1_i1:16-540(-)
MSFTPVDIVNLSNLLEESSIEPSNNRHVLKNEAPKLPKPIASQKPIPKPVRFDNSSIWSTEEIPSMIIDVDQENLKKPEYEIIYRHSISVEETYLGLGDRIPYSDDADHIVIKISLPNEKIGDLVIDETKQSIRVVGKYHKLFLVLPCVVFEDRGQADFCNETLKISFPINKES